MLKLEIRLASIAIFSLALGVILYALFRPAGSTALLPSSSDYFYNLPAACAQAAYGQAPAFIHTFGFTLLTVSALGVGRRSLALSVELWLLIGFAFEFLQHPSATPYLLNIGLSETHVILDYAVGTFDVSDLFAMICGGGAATALVKRLSRETC